MLRKIFIIVCIMSSLLVLTMGCDSILNKYYAPRVGDRHYVVSLCGSSWPTTPEADMRLYDGVYSKIVIDFHTSNVNQEFETAINISSSSVPLENHPKYLSYEFSVIKKDPGKTSGTVRAIYNVLGSCHGSGCYLFNVIIEDQHGGAGTYQGALSQIETPITGDSPCRCRGQCGECKHLTTKPIRCTCNCPNYGEDC